METGIVPCACSLRVRFVYARCVQFNLLRNKLNKRGVAMGNCTMNCTNTSQWNSAHVIKVHLFVCLFRFFFLLLILWATG